MLLVAAALTACEQNAVQQIAGPPEGGAAVKFFNFAVGSPAVNFYIDDVKVTAIGSASCWQLTDANRAQCTTTGMEPTSGTAYGSAANGGSAWYSDVRVGQVNVQARIAVATDKDLVITNLPASVAQGRFYSFYMSGIYNTATKAAESFIIEDVMPAVDFTGPYLRFVNASANPSPLTLVLTHAVTNEVVTIADVAYRNGSAFVKLPAQGNYNLAARNAGTTTNVITRNAVAFSNGRVYTITARGNPAVASTLFLDNTANR